MPEAGKETAATAGEKKSRAGRKGQRCRALDWIRGITLVSMILYHGAWDLVYLFGANWDWYRSKGAYVWQQSICWTFILLSGFCWALGGPDRDGGPPGRADHGSDGMADAPKPGGIRRADAAGILYDPPSSPAGRDL